MVARVNTVAFRGIDVVDVDAQVQMAAGLPAFTLVGLPDKAVAESRERVRAALSALGLALPLKVARTLADLDASNPVRRIHIAEALSYRRIAPGRY